MQKAGNKTDPVESVLNALIYGVCGFISDAGWGKRKLTERGYLVGFVVCLTVAAVGVFFRSWILHQPSPSPILNYTFLGAVVMAPLIYLRVIGHAMKTASDHYKQSFLAQGFVGRDKKPPQLLHYQEAEKRLILRFKSNIPLEEWRRKQTTIETALDVTITRIDPGKSKKVVELAAILADYQIPQKIDWTDDYINMQDGVIVLGESALGPIEVNLNRTPHILFAGETGSGKSVLLRTVLWQMINKGCRVYMVDFKGGVEFGIRYEQYGDVVTEHDKALELFKMLVLENGKRLKLFREADVKNLEEYNDKTGSNLCRIGLFIDELAEMMDRTGCTKAEKEILEKIEGDLSSLARLSRATGINLMLGTQRPDAKVVTGQIKNNVPVRVSGRFADSSASEIVLGNSMATKLPDIKGRFLFKCGPDASQFQAYYFDDDTMLKDVEVDSGDLLIELDGRAKKVSLNKMAAPEKMMDPDEEDEYNEDDDEDEEFDIPTKEILDLDFEFED